MTQSAPYGKLWEAIRLGSLLGLTDIKLQYRRSTLGPLWLSLTLLIQVLLIGLIFARLFEENLGSYLVHLGTGLVVWTFVVSVANDSANSMILSAVSIRQSPIPVETYPLRAVVKNQIQLGHNLVAILPVLALSGTFGLWQFASLIGIAFIALNVSWAGILLGLASARFRDLPAITSGVLTIVFYGTPILWVPDQLPGNIAQTLIALNPVYHLIEIVRQPLLGNPLPAVSLLVLTLSAGIGWAVTLRLLSTKRPLVPFWA